MTNNNNKTTIQSSATTPILAGFYPDPSICRVGEDYYLATSSFEFRPGIPLFTSRDLANWRQVGHILTRAAQMPDSAGGASTGLFAPTLRYHDGHFFMVVTNIDRPGMEQLIVHSEIPEGPWSDPAYTSGAPGIDPDLSWDGEHCYLTWTASDPHDPRFLQARIDPFTARLLETPRLIYRGNGFAYPEAPHFYRHDDWWYLLTAEGGTERGHTVCIARSRSIEGPFEVHPANPIFSHRSLFDPVQNTGHADLVERPDGRWAMVYLAVRPRGTTPGYHVLGRESFLAGLSWHDGWPVVEPGAFELPRMARGFVEDFTAPELHHRWVSPGRFAENFATLSPAGAVLAAGTNALRQDMLLTRVTDLEWRCEMVLDLGTAGEMLALLRMDDTHWCGLECTASGIAAVHHTGLGRQMFGTVVATGNEVTIFIEAGPADPSIRLGGPDTITLGVVVDGSRQVLAQFDGRYISTEVTGGFVGRMLGAAPLKGSPVLRRFTYTPTA